VGITVKQDDKSDIDIIPYLKALDGIKLVFEDKIPIEAYDRIKQEVERFTISKDRIKLVDIDKLLEVIVFNYMKYSFILNPLLDSVYHAFTVSVIHKLIFTKNIFLLRCLRTSIWVTVK